jgi:glucose 1-dehydrogenase
MLFASNEAIYKAIEMTKGNLELVTPYWKFILTHKNTIIMDKKLRDQIAIITGASSGIGAGCAIEMAKAGAIVVVNYPIPQGKEMAQKVVDEIAANGGSAIVYKSDVSKEDEVKQMFADVIKQFGTVDILVNNAGLQKDAPFTEMTLDQWNFVLGVNLTGQFLCARESVKEFLRRGVNGKSKSAGKIICMSSVHEVIPWAGHANYAASKGGVMLMMKTIAQEFAPKKIRINSIAPGAIATPINHDAWDTQAHLQELLKLIPQKRVGKVEDIGKAAVWLASDDSDYVNGTTLFVDGGMTLYPGFEDNG